MNFASRTAIRGLSAVAVVTVALAATGPAHAHADNSRLNKSVRQMVSIVQYKAGCPGHVKASPQLESAAQRHSLDVLNSRWLDGDIGSDGSTPRDRAAAAGYRGNVEETVAINPALAISSLELIKQWHADPRKLATMQNCANTEIGVWSENSLDRTVVVAVYGQPEAK
ncbi:CAP domain-containing protein [Mycolicibacterium pulveris]|uniref:SCP domain-containing protein n=1 Tax=Mycolicibacterium pulveris TaxID=36813 RepID=A0A7I7UNL3_MYCPV|nr:CAP domain-containing protein [Mycolicibacterium pulveris]MCV6981109.1 CAP domain-containing protein [Mycolicibacterium pulveris]BBY82453.1 hypothetical protein MPUL_36110 [Mycolicibacterium pulveris]